MVDVVGGFITTVLKGITSITECLLHEYTAILCIVAVITAIWYEGWRRENCHCYTCRFYHKCPVQAPEQALAQPEKATPPPVQAVVQKNKDD